MFVEPILIVAVVVIAVLGLLFALRKPAIPLPESSDEEEDRNEPGAAQSVPESNRQLKRTAAETPDAKREPLPSSGRSKTGTREPQRERGAEAPKDTRTGRAHDVAGLRQGITKMRGSGGLFGRLRDLFGGSGKIDPRLVEDIEEVLLTSDVGTKTTRHVLATIREGLAKRELSDNDRVWAALRERAEEILDLPGGGAIRQTEAPTVVLMIGVNGAGKTTTIGKLATKLGEEGKRVLLVAGDTFRAAAVQQVQAWGKRIGCEVFAGKEGADPASVVFDAVKHAVTEKYDVVLCDTAGRLHTKSNLMDELRKVHRSTQKVLDGAPHEVLLVVDGTTGQNAVQQANEFGEALPLTGIVLTKLDGTAKGGVVLAIAHEHKVPVRYVGVGERAQDLRDFDAHEFVEALLGNQEDGPHAS